MERNITCIICPRGCPLICEIKCGKVYVWGNTCPKGEQYGKDECLSPMRSVTSVLRISNRDDTMVSVKTSVPVSKYRIFDVMQKIRFGEVAAPVKIGDVLIKDVFGADIIATKEIN